MPAVKMLKELSRYYIEYRAALPLCALLLYLNTAAAVLGRLDGRALLWGFSFFAIVQIMYAYDALFRTREDVVNRPEGAAPPARAWPLLAAAVVPVYVLASAGFWPLLLFGAVVSPLYSNPALSPRRLKTIPGLKTLVNVGDFWVVGVLAPVLLKYDLSAALVFSLLRSTAIVLVFLFSITVLLDIRDIAGDTEGGVRTLPVLFGAPATAGLLVLLLSASGAAAFSAGSLVWSVFAFVLALFSFFAAKPRGRMYYEAVLAVTNIFLAAELAYRLF